MKLKDKIVIVTGAGKGIGRATAELFAKEGAKVVAVSRTKQDLKELKTKLTEIGTGCLTIPCDLADRKVSSRIIKESIKHFGNVDILINNAGIYLENTDTFSDTFNFSNIDNLVNINQLAPWLLATELISKLKKDLCIVNVASVNGVFGKGGSDVYDMTKSATISMTKNLAKRHAKEGIRVNCVNPSSTLTNMRNKALAKYAPDIPREKFDSDEAASIPMGCLGTSEDIAKAILFLASDEASYITGQVLNVDGGYLLNPKLFI